MGFARDKVRCGVCEEEADSGSLLEVEPRRFAVGVNVGNERWKESRTGSRFLSGAMERIILPWTDNQYELT